MKKYDPERLETIDKGYTLQSYLEGDSRGRGTERGGVYCDMTFNPPGFIKKQLPRVYALCKDLGIDIDKEMLEVAPTCHYFMELIDLVRIA
jgi:succinate dehydrogenase/fumarate reductase flavoprotein subunit